MVVFLQTQEPIVKSQYINTGCILSVKCKLEMPDMLRDFLNVWRDVTCNWPLDSGRPSIPPFIWQGSTFSPPPPSPPPPLSSSWHPNHWFQLISHGGGFIQPLPNGILWYVAPMVAGWEATVYTVFRPITLTSQPTHKEGFERPVFGGIRWAFCLIIAEWIQSLQTDMFTKLCVGGMREITCATLNNWGLITGLKMTTCFFLSVSQERSLWTGCYLN